MHTMAGAPFGERLRAVIAAHQTNPKAVADRAGKTIQWLQNYLGAEDNPADANPTVNVLLKIAAAVPASVEELCRGLDEDYDASRRSAPAQERVADLWQLAAQRGELEAPWRVLLLSAGLPYEPMPNQLPSPPFRDPLT